MLSYLTVAKRTRDMTLTSLTPQTPFVLHDQSAKRRNSMTELERIKNIEEQITLAMLLPSVNLGCLPPEESAKLKRAVLDFYRIGHANGFKAGVDHATNAVAVVIPPRRYSIQTQWLMRWLSARMREHWQEFKKSLRSIRVAIIIGPRGRRFPTEAVSQLGDPPVRPRNQRHIEGFSQRRKVLQGSSHS
jgi:hypothetical protein